MPLSPADRIAGEMIIGGYPRAEAGTAAALEIPSRDVLLRGTRLSVQPPGGKQVADSGVGRRVAGELGGLLGGWFAGDAAHYIRLYDGLISEELREYHRGGGMAVREDGPGEAFYYLAAAAPPWQVQVVGEPETFHCVFLGRLLTQSEAIGEGGHPLARPLGEVTSLLVKAAPHVARLEFDDRSAGHAENVFDTYLVNAEAGVTVKAGVRMRLAEGAAAFEGPEAYFYGIRINIDLRRQDA